MLRPALEVGLGTCRREAPGFFARSLLLKWLQSALLLWASPIPQDPFSLLALTGCAKMGTHQRQELIQERQPEKPFQVCKACLLPPKQMLEVCFQGAEALLALEGLSEEAAR